MSPRLDPTAVDQHEPPTTVGVSYEEDDDEDASDLEEGDTYLPPPLSVDGEFNEDSHDLEDDAESIPNLFSDVLDLRFNLEPLKDGRTLMQPSNMYNGEGLV